MHVNVTSHPLQTPQATALLHITICQYVACHCPSPHGSSDCPDMCVGGVRIVAENHDQQSRVQVLLEHDHH